MNRFSIDSRRGGDISMVYEAERDHLSDVFVCHYSSPPGLYCICRLLERASAGQKSEHVDLVGGMN